MSGTMSGLLKETAAPGDFVYRTDLPVPEIGGDEVLIKVRCTAVCGTDLHIMEWDGWSQKHCRIPMIPGHETAGDIAAVGENVKDRKVGAFPANPTSPAAAAISAPMAWRRSART